MNKKLKEKSLIISEKLFTCVLLSSSFIVVAVVEKYITVKLGCDNNKDEDDNMHINNGNKIFVIL